ncbi:N-acetyltransferase [Chitinophaga sp. Cy-1792]|uniref:GNAT family N-acetyltransferase n=1 Tax=Chitinophaga sp. Cy-1792 TaxID=2608339 RepID=UPI001421D18B|nr:GNAT family N-acetyltransferase [Chitinophaga sp. Cy-1792]NIG54852.1 GNAT family N-acetyltransferase [Chitinophaga sp. Cy-1792]
MEVVQATALHTNEVAVLFDAYRSYYDQAPDFNGALKYITERIEKKDSTIFVAMELDEIVGFVQLYPIFSSVSMKKAWLLNDLFVLEEHRGNGAGSALLDAAQSLAKDTDAAWLMLQTYVSNTNAQSLYEKKGYKKDSNSYYYYLSV